MDRTIWFTSDTHFNHNKDFIWGVRGFNSVEEMNEAIIENWNSRVKDNDIVYHLGDVMMGMLDEGLPLVRQLKGEKYLAYGNHDTQSRISAFQTENIFKDIQMGYKLKAGKKTFLATHYPTITANGNDTSVLGLYGHTHQTTNFFADAAGIRTYMYHVGMDSHSCCPVNFEDIIVEIRNLKEK